MKKEVKNRPNITKEEHQAIRELRRDETRMVLTADKGVSMVVMDREDYNNKSEELLNTPTYQILKTDPTSKIKNKLVSLLKTIKAEGGISETTYKKLYPTGATTPKYYGLPKVHKEGTPLRPTVSSIGSATYEAAKELSKILKPLVGRSIHHVKNNQEFINNLQDITKEEDECMMSFDVKSLFTSIPIQPTLTIIKKLLEEDTNLHQRTAMAVKHINWLLEYCLTNTYFSFQGRLYEQKEGAAMGSPISPIAANIFMEDFESRALATSPCTPKIWKRFVDDAFTIIKKDQKQTFLNHLNSINSNIQFTSEDPGEDGSIPFLDMLIIPDGEGRLKTTVYRKPTHTNQYLHWDSHHDIPAKYSVIGTLFHRAKTICSDTKHLQEEEEHLYRSLQRCKYPTWALNRVKMRNQTLLSNKKNNNIQEHKSHITVPYHQGLSESFKRTCKKYGIEVHLKGGHTIRNLLMNPKDRDPMLKRSGIIHSFRCNKVECDEEYIGESARTFGERYKEHQKSPSPIHDHFTISGHTVSVEDFSILAREDQNLLRTIKEAIYIRANNPSLNRNVGKFHLPHIWDEVLLNISELKLK